ncbi:phage tail tape measure protein [Acidocella sp.]|uniref:phage tail tape measure protein n=1 Tax=Acidocella sp. TaxID=50710 RepID=UPI00183F45E9|nr:phage tail tape measure protein [Acidocella sp.]NNM56306.1 phage tail tape measure protein [Acidocella sp.]
MTATYETVIAVVDKASAPILKMQEKITAFGQSAEKVAKIGPGVEGRLVQLETAARKAHVTMSPPEKLWAKFSPRLKEVKGSFSELTAQAGEFSGKIGEIFPMLAGLGAAGSLAGLFEMVHKFAESTEVLDQAAQKIGITAGAMQTLDYAAKQTGLDTDSFNRGLTILNKNLGEAGTGQNKNLRSLLDHLHISLRDTKGNVIGAAAALPALEKAFYATHDAAQKAYIAQLMFGRSGLDMIPFLDQGPDKIAALQAQFAKLGYTPTGADQLNSEKFNEAWREMETAVGGFTDELGAKLMPVLTPIIDKMTDWIAANKDWIDTDISGAVEDMANDFEAWLASMGGIKGVTKDIKTFGHDVHGIVTDLGGAKTVGAALGLVEVASLAPGMMAAAKAIKVLSLILLDNPVGMALAGIALASYEIYEHWADITKAIQDAIDRWEKFNSETNSQQVTTDTNAGLFSREAPYLNAHRTTAAVLNQQTPIPGMPGSAGSSSAAQAGSIRADITLNGFPAGTTVKATGSGLVAKPVTRTGTNGTMANHRES